MLKLYNKLADWWPLLSDPADYAEEAAFFLDLLSRTGLPPAPTMLELGSGGGNNASHLKEHFEVTLTDISPEMLAVSHSLNPECEHIQGDMRTLRLGRQFDIVFAHDAIEYMTSPAELRMAFDTSFVHCRAGGVALFVPDYVHETFQSSTRHGGHDGEGRGLRYLEWDSDPDPSDTTFRSDMVYLLREDGLPLRIEHDLHICGLFWRDDWLKWLTAAGFRPESVQDRYNRFLFIAHKPKS